VPKRLTTICLGLIFRPQIPGSPQCASSALGAGPPACTWRCS
jgi:hypothetical protein